MKSQEEVRPKLCSVICKIAEARGLTKVGMGERLKQDAAQIESLYEKNAEGLSTSNLLWLLTSLGCDVEIALYESGGERGRVDIVLRNQFDEWDP